MKYIKYGLGVLALIIAVFSVSFAPRSYTASDFLLDTYVSVTAYGKNAKSASQKALDRVRELDKQLSAYRADSQVYKINHAGANVKTTVTEECFYVVKQALLLSQKTGGSFDITIKPVMALWDFGGERPRVPETSALQNALSYVDYRDVLLDEETKTVTLKKEGMAIDLGGIAKGYCADEAIKILTQDGIKNAYLDFGGNVVTMGEKPLGLLDILKHRALSRPFVVGIQNPKGARGEVISTHTANAPCCAVVTSGGYERYFYDNGVRYHHILDPKTGKNPQNDVLSVTVIGDSALVCDALSTALFVSGEQGYEAIASLCEEVQIVYASGDVKKFHP